MSQYINPRQKVLWYTGWLLTEDLSRFNGYTPVLSYPDYPAERIMAVRATA